MDKMYPGSWFVFLVLLISTGACHAEEQRPWEVEIDEDGIKVECRVRQKSTQSKEASRYESNLVEIEATLARLQKENASREEVQSAEQEAKDLKKALARSNKEETGFKYCKATFIAPFPMHELIAINLDADGLKDWMDSVKTSYQAKKFSETNYINCMQYKIPVFNDREACAETVIEVDLATGEFMLEFGLAERLINTIGHEPMKIIKGFWKYLPTDQPDRTYVEYGTYVEPGGAIIPFLYNPRAAQVPFKSIKRMLKVLDSGKYKDFEVPFPYQADQNLAKGIAGAHES
ncbi:MAG: hypothetical protein C9356_18790 [Oleiphilus sp.]|nr:MAG: hypothetical protein C9356_18790 [Oleiphilus sp.]